MEFCVFGHFHFGSASCSIDDGEIFTITIFFHLVRGMCPIHIACIILKYMQSWCWARQIVDGTQHSTVQQPEHAIATVRVFVLLVNGDSFSDFIVAFSVLRICERVPVCDSVRISSISSNPRQAFRIPNIYSELWSWNTSAQWATVLVLRDISSLYSAPLPYLACTLFPSAERTIVIVRDYTLYSCVSFFSYFLLSLLLSLLIAVAGRLFSHCFRRRLHLLYCSFWIFLSSDILFPVFDCQGRESFALNLLCLAG